MNWDEMFRDGRCGEPGGAAINSPVTVVEGHHGHGHGGPTINLEQYTDYVLRKFVREQEWGEAAGTYPWVDGSWREGCGRREPWGPNMRFGVVAANVDTPLKAIGSTVLDGLYLVAAGLVCKVPDAAAGAETLTITYYDVLTGSAVITLTHVMTATGISTTGPTPIILLGGSAVTVAVQNAGVYANAKYDAFVGLTRIG